VQALSEEQRQETRTRLNIVVDDTEGSAVPPIESFDDMVKLQWRDVVNAACGRMLSVPPFANSEVCGG
jgi:hypothetical protein